MTKTEAKAATCTEAGNKEYWTCSVCKKVFGDAEGKTETTVEAQTIAATGHKVTAWTQSFDDTTPKHTGTCSVCKKSVTENCADADNNGKCDVCGNNMTKAEEPALYTLSLVCEPDGATAPGTITVKPASASGSATTTTSVVEGEIGRAHV